MKRLVVAILAVALILSGSVMAQAKATKTIKIDRYVTLQVPTSIKIPKGQCADLNVKYTIRVKGIYWPHHTIFLFMSKDTSTSIIRPGDPDTRFPEVTFDGYRGTKVVKLCKYDWVDEEGDPYNAVKNGRYTFYASLMQTEPSNFLFSPKVTITVRG
jgi:hypothetical protein